MNTKHEIEIPDLPEGYRAVAYRRPVFGEYYFYNDDIQQGKTGSGQFLIVEKIKPRRIVLEETKEFRQVLFDEWGEDGDGRMFHWNNEEPSISSNKIWRVVEEE